MSTIVTDTLQGKTSATSITLPTTTNIGATPLVSASANSMTIRGEGSATTNIQQGLSKVWNNLNGTGTIASRDSFNVSGNTDVATGVYTTNYTSAMSSANQSAGAFARVSGLYGIFAGNDNTTFTTTSFRYSSLSYDNGSTGTVATDGLIVTFNICGDLA
tara:strand:+ start:843 stop:1322 length:480 start_codon:yes stop_codon:yes gene_type:complete